MTTPVTKPRSLRESLAWPVMLSLSLRVTIVICVTSAAAFGYIYFVLKNASLERLSRYVTERAQREREIFRLAEDNHRTIRDDLLKRLALPPPQDLASKFTSQFFKSPDGVIRNRPESFDGSKQSGVYIDHRITVDPETMHRVLTYQDVINQYGPAYHNRFQDTYIHTPNNILVMFWPQSPKYVAEMKSTFSIPDEEWGYVADKKHNPSRDHAWTGLFFDSVSNIWRVSLETPVDSPAGEHIATIGHDIAVDQLFQRTTSELLPSTHNMILRADGRIVFHPNWMDQLQQAGGSLSAQSSGDARLQRIHEIIAARNTPNFVAELDGFSDYIGVALIPETGWYLISIYPKSLIWNPALSAALVVFSLGLLSLFVEVPMLYLVLRKQVAKPLQQVAYAAERLAGKDYSVVLECQGRDELSSVMSAFNRLVQVVKEREAELSRHAESLENEVATRTNELVAAKEAAIASSRAKGDFLANMSHEIRTPMNGIIGVTQMLLDSTVADEVRSQLKMIESSACTLLAIINDILDFSKIEAGKLELLRESFNLRETIEPQLAVLSVTAKLKGQQFLVNFDSRIPQWLCGDKIRIVQILMNLVSNAAKFTPTDGVVAVRFVLESTERNHAAFFFEVADSGIGIPEEKQHLIFDAFEQADKTTTKHFGGTGLGLSISRQLAQMMGGDIQVSSATGHGATFKCSLTLPIGEAPADRVTERKDGASSVAVGQLRVLLVEDNPINQTLTRKVLEKRGHAVKVASNGSIALEMNRQDTFDVILMDCQMPIMDGFEATQRIRELESGTEVHIPIVAMTANALVGDRDRCLECGMDDYISKPIDTRKLDIVLINVVRKSREKRSAKT